MADNKILQFGASATDIYSDVDWATKPIRTAGHVSGKADQQAENKVLKGVSLMAAGLAQYIADRQATAVNDVLTPEQIAAMLTTALVSGFVALTGDQTAAGEKTWTDTARFTDHVYVPVGGLEGDNKDLQASNCRQSLGVMDDWWDVYAHRSSYTVYTNTREGKATSIILRFSGAGSFWVGTKQITVASGQVVSFILPPGWSYEVEATASIWLEFDQFDPS
jgi:hypothetical protein